MELLRFPLSEERSALADRAGRVTLRQLEAKGWSVIIVWECELKKAVLDETVRRVQTEILHNGEILRSAQDDRRRARNEYRQEMKARKEHEAALKTEIQEKYSK